MTNNFTVKLLNLLNSEEIHPKEFDSVIKSSMEEINFNLWENVNTSLYNLITLKDSIWYNLEHLPLGGEKVGESDLKFLGKKYPIFSKIAVYDEYILNSDIENFILEIEDVLQKFNENLKTVHLYTIDSELKTNGDNITKIVIHESKIKKQSSSNYISSLVNEQGDQIKFEKDTTLDCLIDGELGLYKNYPILKGLLTNLLQTSKKAEKSNKGIKLVLDEYNYL